MEQGEYLPFPGKQQMNKMPLTLGTGWLGSLWSRQPPGSPYLPRGLHRALPLLPQGLRGEQRLLARFQALEKRFEALEAEVLRWELRRGAAAVAAEGEPPPGDVLALLEGLVSRRDTGLKEHLRADVTSHLQVRGTGARGEVGACRAGL